MRPGSLTRQSRSWDKEYWQISYTHRGRGRTGYISDANYAKVKVETENHKKFKELCAVLRSRKKTRRLVCSYSF